MAETCGSGGEGDGRGSVDDGYAAVEAPPGEEDSTFGALGSYLREAEQEAITDREGVCQEGRRVGRGGGGETEERWREGEGKGPRQEEGKEETGWGESRDHRIGLHVADIKDGVDIESRRTLLNL